MALFLALGGVAYATNSLPGLSVGTKQLKPESVKTGKIADRAVTGVQIRDGAIHSRQMGTRLLARRLGAVGTTGPESLPGMNGLDGAPGPTGEDWATGVAGATGVSGPIGATGPTGASGATGASGVADIRVVTQSVSVNNLAPGFSNSLTAVCPTGYVVIAGGFAGSPGATQAFQSRPDNSLLNGPYASWRAAYVNPTNAMVSGGFTTYAICAPD